MLKQLPIKNLLFIDIETVSGNENIENISPEIQKHWNRKASFIYNSEEKTAEQLYEDRAAIYAEFGKIIVIGIGVFQILNKELHLRVKSLESDNEQLLLQDFKKLVEDKFEQEQLRFCAHNGKEFDFPYIARRMLINEIQIPWSLNSTGKKPWEVNHIDTLELWKFGDRKNFTSLDLLTHLFGIASSKTKMDGSMVTKTYYQEPNGLEKIAEYCREDVIATAQLYLKLNGQPIIPQERIKIIDESNGKTKK